MVKIDSIGTDDRNGDPVYTFADGAVIRREDGVLPNGITINGQWVLRDLNGNYIDNDSYRSDLMESNGYQYPSDDLI